VSADPHAASALRRAGHARGRIASVMLHGRGAGADGILPLAAQIGAVDVTLFAPEAVGRSWWPVSFLAPARQLEPWLGSALRAVDRAVVAAAGEGFGDERIVLVGFSQGGCLALEFAARSGRRFHGVLGISAGLVGTSDKGEMRADDLYGFAPKRFDYAAALAGMPIHIGCHERDPHIPLRRVRESEVVFRSLGANCTISVAPGLGHGLIAQDIAALRRALLPAGDDEETDRD
jgi:phospholipase/carboxylesterase